MGFQVFRIVYWRCDNGASGLDVASGWLSGLENSQPRNTVGTVLFWAIDTAKAYKVPSVRGAVSCFRNSSSNSDKCATKGMLGRFIRYELLEIGAPAGSVDTQQET